MTKKNKNEIRLNYEECVAIKDIIEKAEEENCEDYNITIQRTKERLQIKIMGVCSGEYNDSVEV